MKLKYTTPKEIEKITNHYKPITLMDMMGFL